MNSSVSIKMNPKQKAALVLAGHGSTVNGESSEPVFRHAEEIRRRNLFHEVHEAFWKEEPHFRDVLRQVEAERVYIVPVFISQGYFTETILPREFGLSGVKTEKEGKTIAYCKPVGVHPLMTEALLHRSQTVVEPSPPDPKSTALLIVGHGTSLNENSSVIVYEQARKIQSMGVYAECQAAFMEEEPRIEKWQELTSQPNVIVVPFFISDGLHSYEDIPKLLGISSDVRAHGFSNPTLFKERKIWYARAIGTEPKIVDLILAQIEDFDASHGIL